MRCYPVELIWCRYKQIVVTICARFDRSIGGQSSERKGQGNVEKGETEHTVNMSCIFRVRR